MYNLIIKDILIQKKSLYYALFYAIFFFIVFSAEAFSATIYITGSIAIAYIFILSAIRYDEKNKGEILLNSLPIKRSYIVYSKYASAYVFVVASAIILGIMGGILNYFGIPIVHGYIKIFDMISAMIAITILISLYLPIYFKLGYTKSSYFSTIIFMFMFFIPGALLPTIGNFLTETSYGDSIKKVFDTLNNLPYFVQILLALTVMLAFVLISMSVSLRIYRKRDL